MTDITRAPLDEQQREKWRAEAARSASELKQVQSWGGKEEIKVGFIFNDAVVRVTIPTSAITLLSEEALALMIFDGVLKSQTAHPAAEAPVDPEATLPPAAKAPAEEQCWRRLEPDFTQPCTNMATGGVRLLLFPHQSIQKRYGRKPMLRLILDLPICSTCFPKMTPAEVIKNGMAPGQWGEISKVAQRKNNGILPAQDECAIEPVPFIDPEYAQLRAYIAKQRATANAADSKPADAGRAANE